LFYYEYEILQQVNGDYKLAKKILFSKKSREKMRSDLGNMKSPVFNNLLTSLRTKGVLGKDNTLNKSLRPPVSKDGWFGLILKFEEDGNNKEGEA